MRRFRHDPLASRRRVLGASRKRAIDTLGRQYTKWVAVGTFALAVFTFILALGTVLTIFQQKRFNRKQLDLYELATAPQVFLAFDSLSQHQERNVFYTIRNVGNTPALNVRSGCIVTEERENPFAHERTGVSCDIFLTAFANARTKQAFGIPGVSYLHFRVDFDDSRGRRYFYKATYWVKFLENQDKPGTYHVRIGSESSEYEKLDPQ